MQRDVPVRDCFVPEFRSLSQHFGKKGVSSRDSGTNSSERNEELTLESPELVGDVLKRNEELTRSLKERLENQRRLTEQAGAPRHQTYAEPCPSDKFEIQKLLCWKSEYCSSSLTAEPIGFYYTKSRQAHLFKCQVKDLRSDLPEFAAGRMRGRDSVPERRHSSCGALIRCLLTQEASVEL
jgi:hypothetical protein